MSMEKEIATAVEKRGKDTEGAYVLGKSVKKSGLGAGGLSSGVIRPEVSSRYRKNGHRRGRVRFPVEG